MHPKMYNFTSRDQNNTYVYTSTSVSEIDTKPRRRQTGIDLPRTGSPDFSSEPTPTSRPKTPKCAGWIPFFIVLGIVIIILVLV